MSVVKFSRQAAPKKAKKTALALKKSFTVIFAIIVIVIAIFTLITGPPVQAATAGQDTIGMVVIIGSISEAGQAPTGTITLKATDEAQAMNTGQIAGSTVTIVKKAEVKRVVNSTVKCIGMATAQAKTSQIFAVINESGMGRM